MKAPDSLDDALTDDHVRLDVLLRTLIDAAARRTPDCPAALDDFERRLLRHMDWEERALFPALRAGADPALLRNLESLVIDHDRLREALATLRSEVREGRWPEAGRSLEALGIFLEGHNRDEETGAYTAASRGRPPDASRELARPRLTYFRVEANAGSVSSRISRIAARSSALRCENSGLVSRPLRISFSREATALFASSGRLLKGFE
jgi:hypothetical protein